MKEATLFKSLEAEKVQCTACNHYCIIAEGKRGLCGVRENRDGILMLNVWGEVVARNVDPVEKKPFYHILPGCEVFSIGTFGCNFKCDFCQNWAISQNREHSYEKRKHTPMTPEMIVEYCVHNEIPAIAYTYNEPTIFAEFAYDIGVLAHAEGIKNLFVTNGYMSDEVIDYLAPILDGVNVDIKAENNEFYKKYCRGDVTSVYRSIEAFRKRGVWVEATTLVIPGRNDSSAQLKSIAAHLHEIASDIPWHITAFHPDYKALEIEPTSEEVLHRAYAIGKEVGLQYVYTGNNSDSERQSTYCPRCGVRMIERDWNSSDLEACENGQCTACGCEIPGVWQ